MTAPRVVGRGGRHVDRPGHGGRHADRPGHLGHHTRDGSRIRHYREDALLRASTTPTRPRDVMLLAAAVALLLFGIFLAGNGTAAATAGLSWLSGSARAAPPPKAAAGAAPLRRSLPTKVTIPAINVTASVQTVGRAPDGTVQPPPLNRTDRTGWYSPGPSPGETGPAVVVGHVDSATGPSVFRNLPRLKAGDQVEVTRADRTVVVFTVASLHQYAKAAFPTAEVYGDFSRPSLRLITCGGRWDAGRGEYTDNVVVFATLTSTRRVR